MAQIRDIPDSHTLFNLADPPAGQKPLYTLRVLIQAAITGSARPKLLLLQEIIAAIKARFPWYRSVHEWEDSIRHTLSAYYMFVQVKRPIYHPGSGNYWTVYPHIKGRRPHKRRPQPKKTQGPTLSVKSGASVLSTKGNTHTCPNLRADVAVVDTHVQNRTASSSGYIQSVASLAPAPGSPWSQARTNNLCHVTEPSGHGHTIQNLRSYSIARATNASYNAPSALGATGTLARNVALPASLDDQTRRRRALRIQYICK